MPTHTHESHTLASHPRLSRLHASRSVVLLLLLSSTVPHRCENLNRCAVRLVLWVVSQLLVHPIVVLLAPRLIELLTALFLRLGILDLLGNRREQFLSGGNGWPLPSFNPFNKPDISFCVCALYTCNSIVSQGTEGVVALRATAGGSNSRLST